LTSEAWIPRRRPSPRRTPIYVKKAKERMGAVNGFPSHSYRTSLAIWDHTVLPAARHKCTGRESNSRSFDHKCDALPLHSRENPNVMKSAWMHRSTYSCSRALTSLLTYTVGSVVGAYKTGNSLSPKRLQIKRKLLLTAYIKS